MNERGKREDPRIPQIQAALKKNPDLSAYHLTIAYSVAAPTLKAWERQGLIKVKQNPVRKAGAERWKKTNKYLFEKRAI